MSGRNDWTVKIYTGGVDFTMWEQLSQPERDTALARRWKVTWWHRHPESQKLVRMRDLYRGANRIRDPYKRFHFLKVLAQDLKFALKNSEGPFDNPPDTDEALYRVQEALELAIETKRSTVGQSTIVGYEITSREFVRYLKKRGKERLGIREVSRKLVVEYLDEVLRQNSPVTRNNRRASMSALFTELANRFIIERNFIKTDIPKVRATTRTEKRLTNEQMRAIATHLKGSDPTLLLFIKMLSYMFLRPIEVCRVTVGDVNLDSREIHFDQKTKLGKTKTIPLIILEDLREHLEKSPKAPASAAVFTPSRKPDTWAVEPMGRRNYWTRQFQKVRNELEVQGKFGMYSFRHTYITGLFVHLRKEKGLAYGTAIDELMKITGHNSRDGIENYIHAQDADRPEDWSELIDFRL